LLEDASRQVAPPYPHNPLDLLHRIHQQTPVSYERFRKLFRFSAESVPAKRKRLATSSCAAQVFVHCFFSQCANDLLAHEERNYLRCPEVMAETVK
jgi:hypothetical protein